jgi:hypothetical protein
MNVHNPGGQIVLSQEAFDIMVSRVKRTTEGHVVITQGVYYGLLLSIEQAEAEDSSPVEDQPRQSWWRRWRSQL